MTAKAKPTPPKDHPFWQKLWADLDLHGVAPGTLGEYAWLYMQDPADAISAFPEVQLHLREGCVRCNDAFLELINTFHEEKQPVIVQNKSIAQIRDSFQDWANDAALADLSLLDGLDREMLTRYIRLMSNLLESYVS